MATSTSTLLQLTNLILDRISERRVSVIDGSRNAERVRNAIREAHDELQREAKWSWLFERSVADSWATEIATVSDMGILHQVVHGSNTLGYRKLTQIERGGVDLFALTPYDTDGQYPTYFVQIDDNRFSFNPYPSNGAQQTLITFEYFKLLTFPTTDAGVFEVPERYVPVINYNASAKCAMDIMQRPDFAQTYKVEYERLLGKFRRTEAFSNPSKNFFHTTRNFENPYISY